MASNKVEESTSFVEDAICFHKNMIASTQHQPQIIIEQQQVQFTDEPSNSQSRASERLWNTRVH